MAENAVSTQEETTAEETTTTVTVSKNSKWASFKLRLSLFRIWFVKNLLVWVEVFLIICAVCTFTGQITENTPILGSIIYPIFSPIIDQIREIVEERSIDGLMNFFTVLLSVVLSLGFFVLKLKSISQTDIKSKKTKLALVKAGFYFDENGHLIKKIEKLTSTDIDGDGEVEGAESTEVRKGFFSGFISAVKEFWMILTADFSGTDDENEETYKEILEATNMDATEEALTEIVNTVKESATNSASTFSTATTTEETTTDTTEDESADTEEEDTTSTEETSTFKKILAWIKKIFLIIVNFFHNKYHEKENASKEEDENNEEVTDSMETNETEETIVNETTEDEEITEETTTEVVDETIETTEEVKTETDATTTDSTDTTTSSTSASTTAAKVTSTKNSSNVNEFLAKLKSR